MKDDLNGFIPEAERREIEQIYRSAKTLQVGTQGLWCRLGLHRYSRWWIVLKGEIYNPDKLHVGSFIRQKCICVRCLRIRLRDADST